VDDNPISSSDGAVVVMSNFGYDGIQWFCGGEIQNFLEMCCCVGPRAAMFKWGPMF